LENKKVTQVKFRLNEEELKEWKLKADERNLTLPKFSKQIVNQTISKGKLKQPKINSQQGAEVIRQLAKLGGNVNQIAKWCNSHQSAVSDEQAKQLADNLDHVQKELSNIWQQLK